MIFIEIETAYFKQEEESEHTLQQVSGEDFLSKRIPHTYVLIHTDRVSEETIRGIVEAVPPRTILYFGERATQKELFERFGHFDVTDLWMNHRDTFLQKCETYFYRGQWSGPISPSEFAVLSPNLPGTISRRGRYQLLLSGEYGSEWVTAVTWNRAHKTWGPFYPPLMKLAGGDCYHLRFDYRATEGLSVQFLLTFSDKQGTIERQYLTEKEVVLDIPEDVTVTMMCQVKGSGTLDLRKIYLTKYRGGYGTYLPGDCIEQTGSNEQLCTYFVPGKKTDKLIVSFTGALNELYRFEYVNLSSLEYPVLYFQDNRSRGGAFMLGEFLNTTYEEAVCEKILSTARNLGIAPKDIILNGYSMGSFSALYYGTKLGVGHVLASKPVVCLGDVTKNAELIFSTDGMMTEARMYLTGRTSTADTERLNMLLPKTIGNMTHTTTNYHFFSMSNDELDAKGMLVLLSLMRRKKLTYSVETHEGTHGEKRGEMRTFIFSTLEKLLHESDEELAEDAETNNVDTKVFLNNVSEVASSLPVSSAQGVNEIKGDGIE